MSSSSASTTRAAINSVFLYGTLKQGKPLDLQKLKGWRTGVQEATIVGSIYSLGPYPTVKLDGQSLVRGELHTYAPKDFEQVLDHLDEIEGYNKSNPSAGLYTRHIVDVTVWKTMDGGETTPTKTVPAWVYEYNGHVDPIRRLEQGFWEPGM